MSLIAGKIREPGPITHKSGDKKAVDHVIDVKPDTADGQHIAHCVVFANPDFPNPNAFAKLKQRLVQLIERMDIEPDAAFVATLSKP